MQFLPPRKTMALTPQQLLLRCFSVPTTQLPRMGTTEHAPKRNESDVYDRQIRLWGADAQAKMAKAKVLYIHVTGASSEILKNLVLAGIRASICDSRPVSAMDDTPSLFGGVTDRASSKKLKYATVAEAVAPAVEELNPLLDGCDIVPQSVSDLDETMLVEYRIVVASRLSPQDAVRLATLCTKAGGTFYLVDSFGMNGASVFDLGPNCTYRPELGKKLLEETALETYVPLETALQVPLQDATNRFHKVHPPLPWMYHRCILEYVRQTGGHWPNADTALDFSTMVRHWIQQTSPTLLELEVFTEGALQGLAKVATCEVAPVCAVLGGLIGNEVIKAISGKGEPANNTILLEGTSCKAWTFLVKSKA